MGPLEIILIIAVVLLLFGGRKFPELMKGIGKGVKEYKKASRVDDEEKPADTALPGKNNNE